MRIRLRSVGLILLLVLAAPARTDSSPAFEPDEASLQKHEVPEWFHDAKLGIFIHWGLYSVPAWATPIGTLADRIPPDRWFPNNPYAEWYYNTMRIEGSPTAEYHAENYGASTDYFDFIEPFNEGLESWNPDSWAALFREAGARYVVLTSKHHDGFTLWPSEVQNPHVTGRPNAPDRDICGELSRAVREEDLRMGLYYSGGVDWTFNPEPITAAYSIFRSVGDLMTPEYAAYADAHLEELIRRYQPDVLWNDIAYPRKSRILEIVARYYNEKPEGVINDRFRLRHHDFTTPEYTQLDSISEKKWESCRGLGLSFGYNRNEGPETIIAPDKLIALLVDIVSKNGNLLLNVGPTASGEIPPLQVERLQQLGAWLTINGEAIYGTRPWLRAEGSTRDGRAVRFTSKGDRVYCIVLGDVAPGDLVVEELVLPEGSTVRILGIDSPVQWTSEPGATRLWIDSTPPSEFATTLEIEFAPVDDPQ